MRLSRTSRRRFHGSRIDFTTHRREHHGDAAILPVLHKSTPQFKRNLALTLLGLGVAIILILKFKS